MGAAILANNEAVTAAGNEDRRKPNRDRGAQSTSFGRGRAVHFVTLKAPLYSG